ncbi:MAG: iron chaperone [Anaerolineae bacterium]|jgi:uncharacterized protein YdhG (YjbR/CyaY superfamily)|nr:DUF1801 domain-containing protein [Chloroflexota bacterium]
MADTSTERDGRAEVDAFVAALPEAFRECFAMARAQVLASAEGISERIAWRMPVFRLRRDLVGLSAHKQHMSLHTMSPALAARLAEQFPDLLVNGSTIHFTPERPLPAEVIRAVVQGRLAELGAEGQG